MKLILIFTNTTFAVLVPEMRDASLVSGCHFAVPDPILNHMNWVTSKKNAINTNIKGLIISEICTLWAMSPISRSVQFYSLRPVSGWDAFFIHRELRRDARLAGIQLSWPEIRAHQGMLLGCYVRLESANSEPAYWTCVLQLYCTCLLCLYKYLQTKVAVKHYEIWKIIKMFKKLHIAFNCEVWICKAI